MANIQAAQPRTVERVLLVLLTLFGAYLLSALLTFPFGRDQATFAVVGRTIAQGGAPYRDAWDQKTPGIFLLFALAQGVFGQHMAAIRILEALGLVGFVACALRWTALIRAAGSGGDASSRSLHKPTLPGVFAGVLAIYSYVRLDFWETCNPEGFASFLLAPAVLIAWHLRRRPSRAGLARPDVVGWLTLGALGGAMALLKPHLVLPMGPVAWYALRPRFRGDGEPDVQPSPGAAGSQLGAVARALGLGAAGATLPLAAVAVWLWLIGAWPYFLDAVIVFNRHHVALSWQHNQLLPSLVVASVRMAGLVTPLGWLGAVLCARHMPVGEARAAVWLVVGVLAALLLTVVVQGKFYIYHYGGMAPWYGLLAGWGFAWFWRASPRPWAAAAGLLVLALAVPSTGEGALDFHRRNARRFQLLGAPVQAQVAVGDRLYAHDDFRLGENRVVSAWIRAHTAPADTVYVWGFEPMLYFLAERRQASRYLFNVPMRAAWSKDRYRALLMAELTITRPQVIVVMSGDRAQWVTGNRRDSRAELPGFAQLQRLLSTQYDAPTRFGDFDLYARRASASNLGARQE